jgi:GT2 family glycosyltransferase
MVETESSADAPTVSVVIVNWNGRQYLDACLAAVAAQIGVTFEVILVDNGSTDGSAAYVRERHPAVRVVALAENRGFTGGNNAGVQAARGRYIALLNNDTVANPDWLRTLLAGLDEPAGVALATSRVVYMHDATVVDSAGDGMLRAGGAFKWHHGGPASAATRSREVFGVCGAACLMPKAVFDELGGFDEALFLSHEDVDLSYRARLRGYRCRYVADAVVRHHGSVAIGRLSALAVFHGQRNLEWVYLKNTPGSILVRTSASHVLYVLAAAAHFARLGLLGPFLRAKAAALRGLPRVLRQRTAVQRSRRAATADIWRQLEPGWLATKRREKRFDRAHAGTAL